MTSILYSDTRLMMLRQRRRAFFRRVGVWAGLTAFVASCAFLGGFLSGSQ